jgi:hypothetical protein
MVQYLTKFAKIRLPFLPPNRRNTSLCFSPLTIQKTVKLQFCNPQIIPTNLITIEQFQQQYVRLLGPSIGNFEIAPECEHFFCRDRAAKFGFKTFAVHDLI